MTLVSTKACVLLISVFDGALTLLRPFCFTRFVSSVLITDIPSLSLFIIGLCSICDLSFLSLSSHWTLNEYALFSCLLHSLQINLGNPSSCEGYNSSYRINFISSKRDSSVSNFIIIKHRHAPSALCNLTAFLRIKYFF